MEAEQALAADRIRAEEAELRKQMAQVTHRHPTGRIRFTQCFAVRCFCVTLFRDGRSHNPESLQHALFRWYLRYNDDFDECS